ncbi:MAG: protein phosphatase 2C domain-containing protein [Verrucomicrobiae bacterium]|nr:protein phosphatase 2C domain-containing protein [Verrucomicrobiae bacterium]
MKIAKDGIRAKVRIGYDGKVYKEFRGTDADKRFENEVRVLKVLESRGCDFVPRVIDADPETLTLVTTNCGHPADKVTEEKANELYTELEQNFGVVHDDPFPRNITYHQQRGRFCIIDFELATILADDWAEDLRLGIHWAGFTRSGRSKKENDDSLAVFSSFEGWETKQPLAGAISLTREGVVMAVSDGMGGVKGGAYASFLAVSELRRFLPAWLGDFRGNADPLSTLEATVKDLHGYIIRRASLNPELSGMGATLVCALFFRTEMHFAHVGDSRIYRWREGELEQLSFDHSQVGRLFREGKLNEREARTHPRRNILNQVIGANCRYVQPQIGTISLKAGDWYLLCSDGVIDGLWNRHISEAIAKGIESGESVEVLAENLLDQAYSNAGKDDTTLFLVRITEDATDGDSPVS